ncbi:SMP-30/Gluconolaconase/LRE-like region [Phlyctema vagabunda]|uniref:SMP-30/Gluconolaconase/LRE-like region n=1 Tax=Phlyctema vagabunda TaxID=108571 RepID=A0ABR4PQH4_9HELO
MSLPQSCQVYARAELAAKRHEYFREEFAAPTLPEGGFIIYDERFQAIIGGKPSIEVIGEQKDPFAHEAGVYIPSTAEIFITSNHLRIGGKKKIQISKVKKVGEAWSVEPIEPGIVLANGAVNYKDGVLFCEQGSLTEPGGLVYMEAQAPYKTEVILSNYHGRWFNSVNDVVIHADGSIWFTDPTYGYDQGIRPLSQIICQTYRYDPATGDIRAMDDSVRRPNGLCFSPDQQTLYITDTDGVHGDTHRPGIYAPARAASIYAFDIIQRHSSPFLANKRLFAFADTGIPDGIKCDKAGNVYSGCGDGVHVWTPGGTLIGKIYVPGGCANLCFGKGGEMFLLNEERMWRAQLDPSLRGDLLGI